MAKPSAPRSTSDEAGSVVALCQLSDGHLSPVEEASRRLGASVVSVEPLASARRLPKTETMLRQSLPLVVPVEGGQLLRAAAHARERINGRSLVSEEFARRAPKKPPDKVTENGTEPRRHALSVVSEETEASAVCSPGVEPERALEPSLTPCEAIQEPELEEASALSHLCPEADTPRGHDAAASWPCHAGECLPTARKPAVWAPGCSLAELCHAAGPLRLCDGALDSGKLSLSPYATHIRERINGHSLSCKEFIGQAPKDLPDRLESMAEPGQPVMKVVSKEDEVKEPSRSPDAVAAPVQPCDISSVCPVAVPACLLSGGISPSPVGAARGQCGSLVVSAKCAASAQQLLMFEAAERQSISPVAPSRAAEGEWLARAAENIRERVSERAPTCEEFGCRAPKKPPDKVAEITNELQ